MKFDPRPPSTRPKVRETAEVLLDLGEVDEAESVGRRSLRAALTNCSDVMHPAALRTTLRLSQVQHARSVGALDSLGQNLLALGNAHAAANFLNSGLQSRKAVLGSEHPATIASRIHLGRALEAQGRQNEAALQFAQALRQFEQILGPQDAKTAHEKNLMSALAKEKLLLGLGRREEAAAVWRGQVPRGRATRRSR